MSRLAEKRRAVRLLLDEHNPADALAVHYAFYYPEEKTQIVTLPADAGPGESRGYVAFSRTGIDLFRPFVTLRLPPDDMAAGVDLIQASMHPGAAVILYAPSDYLPLIRALFEIQKEEQVQLLVLDRARFEPVINVLVTQAQSPSGLPRFVIRRQGSETSEVMASAAINWQTPRFAEVSVHVNARHRRRGWGRSVMAAMVQHMLGSGRTPLYAVSEQNEASFLLARSLGFVDRGIRKAIVEATLKSHP